MSILEILGKTTNFGKYNNEDLVFTNSTSTPRQSQKKPQQNNLQQEDKLERKTLELNLPHKSLETPERVSLQDTVVAQEQVSPQTDSPVLKKLEKTSVSVLDNVKVIKKKIKVLFCGTYPIGQSNGYSRVVYYTAKYIGLKQDIDLTIYGFQNFKNTSGNATERNDIPASVKLHDAGATENPKRNGFGEQEFANYIKKNPQDIVIIFNDMIITSMLVKDINEKLSPEERKSFKLVSYMDQVYPYQKPEYIKMLNANFDAVIAFTPYWEDTVRKQGLKEEINLYFYPHGFDSALYFPIPKKIARRYYELPEEAFIILNLNRNQPRKRWDHTMMAFANVVERHYKLILENPTKKYKPIRLMIGTAMQGFWNLIEVFENEIKKRNIPVDIAMKYIATVGNPQSLTDRDINIMYNACDIGINNVEAEGWGLCQFEHLALGNPQIVANIGGFQEYITKENSIVVEPKWNYYVDNMRDGIGGFAEVSDPNDFADGMWEYYLSPEKVKEHGSVGRKEILQHFSWETTTNILYKNLLKINRI